MQICIFPGFLLLMSLSWISVNSDPHPTVRLAGGNSSRQGRIELFHNNSWGTVCDDRVTIEVCKIICRQLFQSTNVVCINEHGYHGCIANDGSVYGTTNSRIWVDSLVCEGSEQSLDACQKSNWGETNCGHKEDAGCICLQDGRGGSCDTTRHRIVPFDANYPNIGRVEVQDENSSWGLVCDDDWDNIDAHVFCDCLGYKGSQQFLALLSPNHTSDLPILYDSVRCNRNDTNVTKNLWDCDVTRATDEHCDPRTEAAAVMCGPRPAWVPPAIPGVSMSCDGQHMTGCLLNDFAQSEGGRDDEGGGGEGGFTDFTPAQFSFSPNCSEAVVYQNASGNILFGIDMGKCLPLHNTEVQSNDSVTHYCYDLSFSKTNEDHGQPHMGQMWSRRLCCVVPTNGTSVGSFLPQVAAPPSVYAHNSHSHGFDMRCYLGDIPTSENVLTFPATVRVGESVSCMVNATSWDPRLTLVASDCKFMTSPNGTGDVSYFIQDKCPNSTYKDLIIDNGDQFRWGFKFGIRKFGRHNELYVSCDVYLCDATKQNKPYCDRSCVRSGRVQRRAGKRQTGKSAEEEVRDDGTTGSVKKGPFRFYDGQGQFPSINLEDQYAAVEESEDDKKKKWEEYEALNLSSGSDDPFNWWHVCILACLNRLGKAARVVFGE